MVSIILPNYNYARYLSQRIDSILNQTFTDFELIILDDASTDNSRELIEGYRKNDKRIKVFYSEINSGNPFVQWKKGIEKSKGNLIWIAEADDWCEPTLLEILANILAKNTDAVLAFTDSEIVDEAGNSKGLWSSQRMAKVDDLFKADFVMNGVDFINHYLIHQNIIPNASAVLFRKDAYLMQGGVDSGIQNCADWLLWIKMIHSHKVAYVHQPLNYFRRHGESVINSIKRKANTQNVFHEYYSMTMRKELGKWLKFCTNDLTLKKENNKYIAMELNNKLGCYISRSQYIKALKCFLASMKYSSNKILPIKFYLSKLMQ